MEIAFFFPVEIAIISFSFKVQISKLMDALPFWVGQLLFEYMDALPFERHTRRLLGMLAKYYTSLIFNCVQ